MGPETVHGGAAVFYRFQDATGRVRLVDSIDSVPQAQRAHAQRIEYQDEPASPSALAHRALNGELSSWQSFGLGIGAALLVVLIFKKLPGTFRLLLRLAIVGGVVALLAGAYFGWMRRATGQSNDALATPGAMIDDAKSAVAKMNARMKDQDTQLKEIEQVK